MEGDTPKREREEPAHKGKPVTSGGDNRSRPAARKRLAADERQEEAPGRKPKTTCRACARPLGSSREPNPAHRHWQNQSPAGDMLSA